MPQVTFVAPGMDVIDLFIGSEGTLGVIVEAELKLLPKPAGVLSGVVFFDNEENLLAFVRAARERSLANRSVGSSASATVSVRSPTVREGNSANLDARAIEYFDIESLNFLRQKYDSIPARATGAIFFEQETTPETEDSLMSEWLESGGSASGARGRIMVRDQRSRSGQAARVSSRIAGADE